VCVFVALINEKYRRDKTLSLESACVESGFTSFFWSEYTCMKLQRCERDGKLRRAVCIHECTFVSHSTSFQ